MTSYFYYINNGIYGSFCILLNDAAAEISPLLLKPPHSSPEYSSTIWGPTCDGLDRVVADFSLPQMNVDDWFVFENMGAYSLAAAGCFNGFPVPQVFPLVKPQT